MCSKAAMIPYIHFINEFPLHNVTLAILVIKQIDFTRNDSRIGTM